MSGHSKWATIKHKKGAADARRGKIFTKIIKEISVAARISGGDPDSNPRLRTAILAAKAENMPADNIKRAIQKGTGELPGTIIEEAIYEAYGPGGAAMIVEVTTDNKNRTTSEIRHMFAKHGGAFGASVAWMFHKKGYVVVEKEQGGRGEAAGAHHRGRRRRHERRRQQLGNPLRAGELPEVVDRLKAAQITPAAAEVSMVPQNYVKLSGKQADQMLRLMDELEDHEDVSHVYANFDIEESELQALTQEK